MGAQHLPMEILAPAGDEEMLRAAVFSGADCVYLGVSGFNARRGAANFEGEGLRRAAAFCHARGCGVYAALNTLVPPGREKDFAAAVWQAAEAGCDGLIVQDFGGAMLAKKLAPGLPLHASTQMSVHSAAGVRMLARLGFARVILAREMSEGEIALAAQAAKETGVDLEVFVHGALCVSVSGQCAMSAFLGGRSGNQGACAGPCRLPFRAERGDAAGAKPAPEQARHHLSLKDLSILDTLPRLAAMGVASAKIEGRLRGPEYCAAVVDAARKALRGEGYDKQWLCDIFSRDGFTDGWFAGKNDARMFGVRTEAGTAAAKAALPRARALYRREAARVPVKMALRHDGDALALWISDGENEIVQRLERLPQSGDERAAQSARQAVWDGLQKTGGTPFYVEDMELGDALPSPAAARAARRQGLEMLLALRETPPERPGPVNALPAVDMATRPAPPKPPALRARFASAAQLPPGAQALCEELLLPLFEADEVPPALRGKTRLWLPRVLFGGREKAAAEIIQKTKTMGFAGYEVENIAHLLLCEGLPVTGGAGLNTANALSAREYARLGCAGVTLSPELRFAQMRALVLALPDGLRADAPAYGRLPLMFTRACPLRSASGCGGCPGRGSLVDRKGAVFPLACEGGSQEGVRVICNSVPLWMADRLDEWPADTATLHFTGESRDEAAAVLRAFAAGEKPGGPFTRGLYGKGTAK